MFQCGHDGSEPRRCFAAKSLKNNISREYYLPIGYFNEPISPTMIYDFCQKWS